MGRKESKEIIYFSLSDLENFASLRLHLGDMVNCDFPGFDRISVRCEGTYRFSIDDMRNALYAVESENISAINFFLYWLEPLFRFLYEPLCLDETLGLDVNQLVDYKSPTVPETDEELLRWIFGRLSVNLLMLRTLDITLPASEIIDSGELIRMIDWQLDEFDMPVEERHYIDAIKSDFLKGYDNDLILRDTDELTKLLFRKFCDELATEGDANALRIKGYACYGGNSVYESDWQTAADCMERLWRLGFGYAANTLGYMHYNGSCNSGIPNYRKAFFYFSIASSYNIFESKLKIADMFLDGHFVSRNYAVAVSILDELYNEEKKQIQENIFTGLFPEVAYRMAKIIMSSPKMFQDEKIRTYSYLLQARFALAHRMKQNASSSDEQLLRLIESDMAELHNMIPEFRKKRKTFRSAIPLHIDFFMGDDGCIFKLKVKKLKNNRIKITIICDAAAPIADFESPDFTGNTRQRLLVFEEFSMCTLSDTYTIIAENADYVRFCPDDGLFTADRFYKEERLKNTYSFSLGSSKLFTFSAESYLIKKIE